MLTTVVPTKHQLTVLAIIAANQEKPVIAQQLLAHNQNLIAARNLLMQWNAIEIGNGKIGITDVGLSIAKDNDIMDDGGQLTDKGQQLLPQEPGQEQNQQQPGMTDDQSIDLPTDQDADQLGGQMPPMEGFSSLFRSALLG